MEVGLLWFLAWIKPSNDCNSVTIQVTTSLIQTSQVPQASVEQQGQATTEIDVGSADAGGSASKYQSDVIYPSTLLSISSPIYKYRPTAYMPLSKEVSLHVFICPFVGSAQCVSHHVLSSFPSSSTVMNNNQLIIIS
jgi:hypothetical protein